MQKGTGKIKGRVVKGSGVGAPPGVPEIVLRKTGSFAFNIAMLLFSITCIYPVIWIIYSSMKTKDEFMLNIMSLPSSLNLDNYVTAFFDGEMYIYFVNSIFNSVLTVALVIFISFSIGYALSRFNFRFRNVIYTLFLAGIMIPIYSLIVPLFVQFRSLELTDKLGTLILPYVAIRLPLAIFLFESFIRTVPRELDEAAYIDGTNTFYTMWRIIFPLCKPVTATVLILTFLDTWNEFPFALVLLTQRSLRTLPVGLTDFYGQYTTEYTTLMAALVLSMLPVIIVYLAFRNKIIQGMTAGAVKG